MENMSNLPNAMIILGVLALYMIGLWKGIWDIWLSAGAIFAYLIAIMAWTMYNPDKLRDLIKEVSEKDYMEKMAIVERVLEKGGKIEIKL